MLKNICLWSDKHKKCLSKLSKLLKEEDIGVETALAAEDMLAQAEESDVADIPEIEDSEDEAAFEDVDDGSSDAEADAALEEAESEAEAEEENTEALIGGTSSMATMDINFNNLSATSYF